MAFTEFISIGTDTTSGTAKKFDIIKLNNPILIPDTPTEWSSTLDGSTVSSEGIGKIQFSLDAMVRYGETRSGYGTMANMVSVFTSAGMQRYFVDWFGTVYTVHLLNKGGWKDNFDRRSATVDAANSLYFVKLELRVA